jgi:serpin B
MRELWLACVLTLRGAVTAETILSQGITDFALQLSSNLEFLSDSAGKNFVWSPYSAHSAFSQVLLGAEGRTGSEMADVLGIKIEDTAEYEQLRSSVKSGNSTLKIANLLALAKGFKPKQEYRQNLLKRFGSQIFELDFNTKPKASLDQINNFVATNTNNKIEELLTEDNIDSTTRMILVNAVYFKALWKTAFNVENTFESEFNTSRGVVSTPFMTLDLKARIIEEEDYRVLELPYQGEDKALLVVLPNNEEVGVMDLIRTINFTDIRSDRPGNVKVLMPKFKIKERTKLKSLMEAAGMRKVFDNSAELAGISDEALAVDEAVQEAFIEVNEEGTEAAAATGIILGLRIGIRRSQFIVNRPFGFVVYDYNQEVPLFIGKVNDPSSGISTRSGSLPQSVKKDVKVETAANTNATETTQSDCGKQRENIPNALNNVQLCQQATDGKLFDWLRSYRAVCEESNKVNDNFKKNNCVIDWCKYAQQNLPEWQAEERQCRGRQLNSCRTNDNRLKAYTNLKCSANTSTNNN